MGLVTTRSELSTNIEGSTGGTAATLVGIGRAVLGWKERGLGDENLYNDLVTNGPLVLIGMPTVDLEWTRIGPGAIPIMIYIAKDKGADWDGQDITLLVESLLINVVDNSNYATGFAPDSFGISGYDYEFENSPGIVMVSLEFGFIDPPMSEIEKVMKRRPEL